MAYKIAFASSDGTVIDRSFRDSDRFVIYEVSDGGEPVFSEVRTFLQEDADGCREKAVPGCDGPGTGCGGPASPKLGLLEDCRAFVCTQIGINGHKNLLKKHIKGFTADGDLTEAAAKIAGYFGRLDNHLPLAASGQK